MTPTTCTATNCDRPTHTYLCADCTRDLQAWIDLAPGYADDLYDTMAKLDNVRPTNMGGGNGATKPAPPAPINLDAAILRTHLTGLAHTTAAQLANDPNAAGIMTLIIQWCTNAELLISGPEAEQPTDPEYIRNKLREIRCEPMTARHLIPWLRKHGITVERKQLNNWVMNGRIKAIRDDPENKREHPKYEPTEVYFAHLNYSRQAA